MIELYQGDCLDVMRGFEPACMDLTVTSPPYDNLRTYKGYTFDFEGIARELYRVTKPGGVVVWVVGDETIKGSETGTSFRQALFFKEIGFNLHDTMIYQKPGMRYPDAARYNAVFEYMFVFSVGPPKTYNPIQDRRNTYVGVKIARAHQVRSTDGVVGPNSAYRNDPGRTVREIGIRNNVWIIPSGSENAKGKEHPATFPEALARDHILSWSNPGDMVFDPMMGSGTTGKMAVNYGRNFTGCEIAAEYYAIAERRIRAAQQQPGLLERT